MPHSQIVNLVASQRQSESTRAHIAAREGQRRASSKRGWGLREEGEGEKDERERKTDALLIYVIFLLQSGIWTNLRRPTSKTRSSFTRVALSRLRYVTWRLNVSDVLRISVVQFFLFVSSQLQVLSLSVVACHDSHGVWSLDLERSLFPSISTDRGSQGCLASCNFHLRLESCHCCSSESTTSMWDTGT